MGEFPQPGTNGPNASDRVEFIQRWFGYARGVPAVDRPFCASRIRIRIGVALMLGKGQNLARCVYHRWDLPTVTFITSVCSAELTMDEY